MKIAIATATYFADAIANLLEANQYSFAIFTPTTYILVNTDKKTAKSSDDAKGRPVYNPTSQWAAITSLVQAVAAPAAPVAAPAAVSGFRVGDRVTATNTSKTKPKFRLQPGHIYTVDRVTAKGNVGLAGLPNDEYLASRFTKVGTPAATAPAAAAVVPVDDAGNSLRVGDTVLVTQPQGKKAVFSLRPNGIATITRITAKGALGFDFDRDNEFLAKRFHKVTLAPATRVQSGDLVVNVKPRRDGRFALPENTALTFRGLTVRKGNFILDGYPTDQYAPSRFQKVVKA